MLVIVFKLTGSLNKVMLIIVNTIIPTANPINLLGHISPPNPCTKYCTDLM